MNLWQARLVQWRSDLIENCAILEPHLPQFQTGEQPSFIRIWKDLADPGLLLNIGVVNSESETSTMPIEMRRQAFIDASQEHLMDCFRFLLCDRLSDLFPVQDWIKEFLAQRLLREMPGGGLQWKPPISQRGLDRVAEQLCEPARIRLHDTVQGVLSSLEIRAVRYRMNMGQDPEQKLEPLYRLFERRSRQSYRDIVLSLLNPFKIMLGQELSQLETQFESNEALTKRFYRWFGEPRFPTEAKDFLNRGWRLQAVMMGGYLMMGWITEHEMKLAQLWEIKANERKSSLAPNEREVRV